MRTVISQVARTEGVPHSPEHEKQPAEQQEEEEAEALPVEPAAELAPREKNYLVSAHIQIVLLLPCFGP